MPLVFPLNWTIYQGASLSPQCKRRVRTSLRSPTVILVTSSKARVSTEAIFFFRRVGRVFEPHQSIEKDLAKLINDGRTT